jgi:hypothetical protein
VAPVNEADTVLLPEGWKGLKRVAKRTGLVLEGAYLNLNWLQVLGTTETPHIDQGSPSDRPA